MSHPQRQILGMIVDAGEFSIVKVLSGQVDLAVALIVRVQHLQNESVFDILVCTVTAVLVVEMFYHSNVVAGSKDLVTLAHNSCSVVFRALRTCTVMGGYALVLVDWVCLIPLTTYSKSTSCVGSWSLCCM